MSLWRRVTLAPGHDLVVRVAADQHAAPGKVAVRHRRRGLLHIPEASWNEGSPA